MDEGKGKRCGMGWGLHKGVQYAPLTRVSWWEIGSRGDRFEGLSRGVRGDKLTCRAVLLVCS